MEIFGHVYQCFRKELWQIVFNNISSCFFTRRVAHLFKMNIEKCGPIRWYIVLGSNSVSNDIMNIFGAGWCWLLWDGQHPDVGLGPHGEFRSWKVT